MASGSSRRRRGRTRTTTVMRTISPRWCPRRCKRLHRDRRAQAPLTPGAPGHALGEYSLRRVLPLGGTLHSPAKTTTRCTGRTTAWRSSAGCANSASTRCVTYASTISGGLRILGLQLRPGRLADRRAPWPRRRVRRACTTDSYGYEAAIVGARQLVAVPVKVENKSVEQFASTDRIQTRSTSCRMRS